MNTHGLSMSGGDARQATTASGLTISAVNQMSKKPPRVKNYDPAKREWIRRFPCHAHKLHECVFIDWGVECSHEKHGNHKNDDRMGPACRQLHEDLHTLTKAEIKTKYGFVWSEVCAEYHEAWLAEREWAA